MKLVIVESPAKIKKLESFLGNEYVVLSSYGHIMDLNPSHMAIDFDNDYNPDYKFYTEKLKVSNNKKIKDTFKKCDELIIASDLDREGEFIGYSLVYMLKPKKYKRIIFNEITKTAILNSINNPTVLNDNVINSQKCRRYLDRILGYTLSPLLSYVPELCGDYKLGCGRVQSIVIKIIMDKEQEIKNFLESDKSNIYECSGSFDLEYSEKNDKTCKIDCVLYKTSPKLLTFKLEDSDNAYETCYEIMKKLKKASWSVFSIKNTEKQRNPNTPFITSSLQKTASNMFGWNIKRIMQVAQKLYEIGKITYMRTDCYNISKEAVSSIKKYIVENYGEEYYKFRKYSSNTNAQEAHECIRPTKIDSLPSDSTEEKDKLYKLIWQRTVASLMSDAIIGSSKISLIPTRKNKQIDDFLMIGNINFIKFKGFLKIIPDDSYNKKFNFPEENDYCNINVYGNYIKMQENIKNPPVRYNQSGMVQKMEELSIGRPSTYVNSISKVIEKGYVDEENIVGESKKVNEIIYTFEDDSLINNKVTKKIGKENNKLVPTNTGTTIVNFLCNNFSDIMKVDYSAKLEEKLDLIADNKINFITVLDEFRKKLEKEKEVFLEGKEKIKFKGGSNKNDKIICSYKEENIVYTKTKAGKKVLRWKNNSEDTTVWVDCSTKPNEEEAIKMINDKIDFLKNPSVKPKNQIIKTIGNYNIKKGPYGNYIQITKNGKVKFISLKNIDIETLTEEKCKELIEKKK